MTVGARANNISIVYGRGEGKFFTDFQLPVLNNPSAVAGADLDGDGDIDLVAAKQGTNELAVLLGDGRGAFAVTQNLKTGTKPTAVAYQ